MVSYMNRLFFLLLFLLTGLGLEAQTFSSIIISTNPNGARYSVDGQMYNYTQTFVWPTGSEHILQFITDSNQGVLQTTLDGLTQYRFSGWVDNAGLLVPTGSLIQTITANPAITSITATLTVAYLVRLNYFASPSPTTDPPVPPVCGAPGGTGAIPAGETRPGVVYISNACYWSSVNLFIQANSLVNLNAFPYPGWVFLGWDLDGQGIRPYLTSLTITGPVTLIPEFTQGKLVHFLTNPLGLEVLVDHETVPTRTSSNVATCPIGEDQAVNPQTEFPPLCFGDFYFAPGSAHLIGGVSPQRDKSSNWWVFNNWSNGLAPNSLYTADTNTGTAATLTGNFVAGAEASFLTVPSGLQLTVDGQSNWPSYNFVWGVGSTHTVAAAAAQFSAAGRQYTFQGWSNAGGASQSVTVTPAEASSGLRMTATYSILSRVVVQSTPGNVSILVDGTSCQTPCTIDRQNGTQVHLTAQTQIPMGTGARLDFSSWSDGGASDHVYTVNQDYTTLTLSYTPFYQLSAASSPANGIAFQFSPSSSDMFYAQNTRVTVTAVANAGFKFLLWNGALSGAFPSGVVTMSVPQSVTALANTVPYIAPAGVGNAAGVTPSSSVAPGSIISIYGEGLAPNLEIGPTNPVSQSLLGVSVTVNGSILGLLFVSPQQINAQLPSSLSAGSYTLLVHSTGQPDVSSTFSVSRDAPGLFFQTISLEEYSIAMHADGSMVTPDSPAASGETISFLGTGFGPYNATVVDGFFPPNPAPTVTDSVTLSVGSQSPSVTWSGAAAGYTGVTLTSFQVPTGLPSGKVPLSVSVNGTVSNTVQLPLQ
jgi:uncharacterized protein (TIGR03437 family)